MKSRRDAFMVFLRRFLAVGFCLFSSAALAEVRTWTGTDGRTLEAEFVSATEKDVTVRRKSDGRRFTLPLDKISDADRQWVTDKAEETTGPEPKEATGLFADKLNDAWEKMEYESLKFRFYGGRSLKAKQRYPVVVYLHGRGSGGTDNEKNLQGAALKFAERDFYKNHPSFVIVPQCPDDNTGWRGEYLDDVIGLLGEALENLPVDKDRIYITGVSMGGYGTWSALAHSPKLFAAAVPVCGGGSPATAKSIKDIAIWAHHGAADDVVPVEGTRGMVEALEKARGNIRYTEYDEASGIKHDAWTPCYGNPEVYEWIFKQRRGKKMDDAKEDAR